MKLLRSNISRILFLFVVLVCCIYSLITIASDLNRNCNIYFKGVMVEAKLISWKTVHGKGNDHYIKYQFEYPENSGLTYGYSYGMFLNEDYVSIPPNDYNEALKTKTIMVRVLAENPRQNYPFYKQRYFIGDINTNIYGCIILKASFLLALLIGCIITVLKLINEWKIIHHIRTTYIQL